MQEVKNVEDVLSMIDAAFTIYEIDIWSRDGRIPSKGFDFDNAKAAIAAYGDEKVYKWKLESMGSVKVCVTINLWYRLVRR